MRESPRIMSAEVSSIGGVQTAAAAHARCLCMQIIAVQVLQAGVCILCMYVCMYVCMYGLLTVMSIYIIYIHI